MNKGLLESVYMTFMMKYWETDDWADIYAFAQRQAITGLVFGEIEKSANNNSNMPKQLLFQWLGDAERIKQQNFMVNREVEALGRLLDENGVRLQLKGMVGVASDIKWNLQVSKQRILQNSSGCRLAIIWDG